MAWFLISFSRSSFAAGCRWGGGLGCCWLRCCCCDCCLSDAVRASCRRRDMRRRHRMFCRASDSDIEDDEQTGAFSRSRLTENRRRSMREDAATGPGCGTVFLPSPSPMPAKTKRTAPLQKPAHESPQNVRARTHTVPVVVLVILVPSTFLYMYRT